METSDVWIYIEVLKNRSYTIRCNHGAEVANQTRRWRICQPQLKAASHDAEGNGRTRDRGESIRGRIGFQMQREYCKTSASYAVSRA
jgi:hypothetical protein